MVWNNEKYTLPGTFHESRTQTCTRRSTHLLKLVVIGTLSWAVLCSLQAFTLEELGLWVDVNLPLLSPAAAPPCSQVDVLTPEKNEVVWSAVGDKISSDAFQTRAINWLSGAVQIP
jgi:hypothetical protein